MQVLAVGRPPEAESDTSSSFLKMVEAQARLLISSGRLTKGLLASTPALSPELQFRTAS